MKLKSLFVATIAFCLGIAGYLLYQSTIETITMGTKYWTYPSPAHPYFLLMFCVGLLLGGLGVALGFLIHKE